MLYEYKCALRYPLPVMEMTVPHSPVVTNQLECFNLKYGVSDISAKWV